MLKVLLVSGLLLTAAPAVAQTQAAPANNAPQAKSKDDPDRVICQKPGPDRFKNCNEADLHDRGAVERP